MIDDANEVPIPVSLLTGFLGSGKTTVLNYLLQMPELSRTAVVINEFGEIGLDHELVEATTENLVLLQSGCICCTIRGDLVETLYDLCGRRDRREIQPFDRVIVETTGLADPAPILHALMTDRFLAAEFRLDGGIATVDAAAGSATLDAQEEAIKQAAMADRIVLTKIDLVEPDVAQALEARLRQLNPGTPIIRADNGIVEPSRPTGAGLYDPVGKSLYVQRWLKAEAYPEPGGHRDFSDHLGGREQHNHQHGEHHNRNHDVNRHDDRISAVSYTIREPIPAAIFDLWLETLMRLSGPKILRIKGIVNIEGAPGPYAIHGVQHIFHPSVRLGTGASSDPRSRIVLIGRDLTDEFLADSFGFLSSASNAERDGNA